MLNNINTQISEYQFLHSTNYFFECLYAKHHSRFWENTVNNTIETTVPCRKLSILGDRTFKKKKELEYLMTSAMEKIIKQGQVQVILGGL